MKLKYRLQQINSRLGFSKKAKPEVVHPTIHMFSPTDSNLNSVSSLCGIRAPRSFNRRVGPDGAVGAVGLHTAERTLDSDCQACIDAHNKFHADRAEGRKHLRRQRKEEANVQNPKEVRTAH